MHSNCAVAAHHPTTVAGRPAAATGQGKAKKPTYTQQWNKHRCWRERRYVEPLNRWRDRRCWLDDCAGPHGMLTAQAELQATPECQKVS